MNVSLLALAWPQSARQMLRVREFVCSRGQQSRQTKTKTTRQTLKLGSNNKTEITYFTTKQNQTHSMGI